ncbi:MAG: DUF3784 domain-containing protein [Bacteroidaceae bacterium]|nr:DUF3784 domain-containing protein [Bacteroidaceae bacterium]
MFVSLLILTLTVVLAAVIVSGKGDWLIAGYNRMKAAERARVHLRRLRIVVAATLVGTGAVIVLPYFTDHSENIIAHLLSAAGVTFVAIIGVVLANTWCVKNNSAG